MTTEGGEPINSHDYDAGFWDRTTPRVMGDFVKRPPALALAWPLHGRRALEVGCGAGYFTRMIAASGAEASGCDCMENAVARAQVHESATPLGVSYRVADMTATGYDDGAFDLIFHVGSLLVSARDEIVRTLAETYRTLASGGVLVLSVTHPSLYLEGSVSRSDEPTWIRHAPLEPGLPYGQSQRFHEHYYDVDGNDYETVVWHHPLAFYREVVLGTGFRIERVQEPIVSPQHLVAAHWGARHGYPAVFQLRAEKF